MALFLIIKLRVKIQLTPNKHWLNYTYNLFLQSSLKTFRTTFYYEKYCAKIQKHHLGMVLLCGTIIFILYKNLFSTCYLPRVKNNGEHSWHQFLEILEDHLSCQISFQSTKEDIDFLIIEFDLWQSIYIIKYHHDRNKTK